MVDSSFHIYCKVAAAGGGVGCGTRKVNKGKHDFRKWEKLFTSFCISSDNLTQQLYLHISSRVSF